MSQTEKVEPQSARHIISSVSKETVSRHKMVITLPRPSGLIGKTIGVRDHLAMAR